MLPRVSVTWPGYHIHGVDTLSRSPWMQCVAIKMRKCSGMHHVRMRDPAWRPRDAARGCVWILLRGMQASRKGAEDGLGWRRMGSSQGEKTSPGWGRVAHHMCV
eukprot:363725-Chlamydomonas_euryale.AAC.3